jgi:hypothetical protein
VNREEPHVPEINSVAESFYSGALRRISRDMLVLAGLFTVCTFAYFGYQKALGFAAGAAISYLNFVWLKRAVIALAGRIVGAKEKSTGGAVVAKFLLRYFVAGLVAFLLYKFLPAAMYGFLAGLFLPVAAIFCEAGFETYVAITRGT